MLRAAAGDSVAAWDAPLAARAAHVGVARSGDFAWARGTYALGPADAPAETGAFLRVWRLQPDRTWKLAVEVISPGGPPRRRQS
jgi:ketosteroid isomerase-like protein